MGRIVTGKKSVKGEITVPGDKSISHRSVMLGALAKGTTEIDGYLKGDDCLATIDCFKKLGAHITISGDHVTVKGEGLHRLRPPKSILDVGNSGTTIRLMLGILAGQTFKSTITGDRSIQKRPMDRVLIPLRQMGAVVEGQEYGLFAPVTISGGNLQGISYTLPVASAQVKSAILLSSLYAKGETVITEPTPSRDHTEIMLNHLGADIRRKGNKIYSSPVKELRAKNIKVPGDISSAAFFIVAATILNNSALLIKNIGTNPTRTGIITALQRMGANILVTEMKDDGGEPTGNILVKSAALKPITLQGNIIATMIDEIPVFAVAALFAKGITLIKDAQELKVKESNRIQTMVAELSKMGAKIEETADGMIIEGGHPLHGAEVLSHGDHRVAMSLAIAGLMAEGETEIMGAECCDVSFPGFFDVINTL